MKNEKIILVILIFCMGFCSETLFAQYAETNTDTDRRINLSAGYKHLKNNFGNYDVATLDIRFPINIMGADADFGGSVSYGKNYISCDILSFAGLLFYAFYGDNLFDTGYYIDSSGTYYIDNWKWFWDFIYFTCIFSNVSTNIRITDFLNIRPYFNAFRFIAIPDIGFRSFLNATVGSYVTFEFGKIMINPFCEYTFFNESLRGYAFGVSLGIKL